MDTEGAEAERVRALLGGRSGSEWSIDVASGVAAAKSMLCARDYDVVLVDLTSESNAALQSILRARQAETRVPVVVMTGLAQRRLGRATLRLGAQDHLIKPELTPNLLERSLLHAIERNQPLRELAVERQREHFLAKHDGLTGLLNRGTLKERLRLALEDARRDDTKLAVLFIDLDGFKAVNDTLGHASGDELLKAVARRLTQSIRETDILARIGADEFVIAIRNVVDDYALAWVLESIRTEMAKPFELCGRECWITASIGVATFPRDGTDAEPLIRSADAAMYHAKAQGPNQFEFYRDELDANVSARFQLVNNLHEAIDRDELVLVYQPQVDVGLREIIGAEALLRWRHPERGLISPGEFIGIAEETGMIMPIGAWVLRRACEDVVRWRIDPRKHFRVGVNASSRQIGQPGFSQEVAFTLAETGLPASRLEIEVTETSVLETNEATLSTLANLRKIGVTIAMDDFGTGYSPLTLLKELELDRLKIDQSFIRGSEHGGPDHVIVGGLIGLARGLGITPIGEGIENAEQLRALYDHGCHQMQGYLFGKPVSAEEFAELLGAGEWAWEAEVEAAGLE